MIAEKPAPQKRTFSCGATSVALGQSRAKCVAAILERLTTIRMSGGWSDRPACRSADLEIDWLGQSTLAHHPSG
jgi:hypothetical protein